MADPPAKVTELALVSKWPLRSKTEVEPLMVMGPAPMALSTPNCRVPPLTVVIPP